MLKMERLCLAIAEHEGWEPAGSPDHMEGTIAYRNHNPGNLRSSPFQSGTKNGYAVFKNDMLGMNALHYDIMQKAKGNTSTKLGPNSTIRDLIFTYAPPADGNDSEAYLASVIKMTGFKEDTKLSEIAG